MKKILTFAIATLALLCTVSCGKDNVPEKSQVPQVGKETSMKHFADINVVGSMQVIYKQGDTHSVRVEAEPKAFDKLLIYVKGNELFVTSKDESQEPELVTMMENVKVYVTSPSLIEVSVTGTGVFTSTSPVNVANLDIELTGSGAVSFEKTLSCKSLDVELTGTGNVKLASISAKRLTTKVTGTGEVDYADLKVEHAESTITGTGHIAMQGAVKEHIKNVTGSGQVVMTNN